MTKLNLLFANLLTLIFVFGLNSSGLSFGHCPGGDCPQPFSNIPGTVNCNPNWAPRWDYESTGTSAIANNSQQTLYVNGGRHYLTWTVSDPGFYFDEARTVQEITTTSKNVIIYTDDTACGAGNIQVTDSCGYSAYGSVKSSNGKWTGYTDGCFGGEGYLYQGGSEYAWFNTTKLEMGKYTQYQSAGITWAGDFGQNCSRCSANCETASSGDPGRQCEPCLEARNDVPCVWQTFQGWKCQTYEVFYQEWVCN